MGALMRQYWIPALMSSELPRSDGAALRVRLLGESLVAFRDSTGAVGLLAEKCPHRGASLFIGRNEEGGLRCVYHGWKFSVSGRCLETPNEPAASRLTAKVRATAYPCRERHGIIWAYMGPRKTVPPLPDFEWNFAPDNVPFMWRQFRACNWLQALEGDLDSSHVSFLHARLDDTLDHLQYVTAPGRAMPAQSSEEALRTLRRIKAPDLEVVDTDYGVMYTAKRSVDGDLDYHRIHHFLFPFHTMVGGGLNAKELVFNGKAWIPMDDRNTLNLEWQFRPGKPWTEEECEELRQVRNPWGFLPATSEPGGAWRPKASLQNDYFRDAELERTTLFSGIQSNPLQDAAVQESMGPIVDRTAEHLGASDAAVTRVRRRLIRAARALQERGTAPPGVDDVGIYRCRPVGVVLPKRADWMEATTAHRLASGRSAPSGVPRKPDRPTVSTGRRVAPAAPRRTPRSPARREDRDSG
jgi:phthalate 4,5-dioxygenase oxygenase subunit